jgi:hypothetical protein
VPLGVVLRALAASAVPSACSVEVALVETTLASVLLMSQAARP